MSKAFASPAAARQWLVEQGMREVSAGQWEGPGKKARLRDLLTEAGEPGRVVVEFK
jgi:hypothetical protein